MQLQVVACQGNWQLGFVEARRKFHDCLLPLWLQTTEQSPTSATNAALLQLSVTIPPLSDVPDLGAAANIELPFAIDVPRRAEGGQPTTSVIPQALLDACRAAAQELRDLDSQDFGLGVAMGLVNSPASISLRDCVNQLRDALQDADVPVREKCIVIQCKLDALFVLCRASYRQYLSLNVAITDDLSKEQLVEAYRVIDDANAVADAAAESLAQLKVASDQLGSAEPLTAKESRNIQHTESVDLAICTSLQAGTWLELRQQFPPNCGVILEAAEQPIDLDSAIAEQESLSAAAEAVRQELHALDELSLAMSGRPNSASSDDGNRFNSHDDLPSSVHQLMDELDALSLVPSNADEQESSMYTSGMANLKSLHVRATALLRTCTRVFPALTVADVGAKARPGQILRSVSSLDDARAPGDDNVHFHDSDVESALGFATTPAHGQSSDAPHFGSDDEQSAVLSDHTEESEIEQTPTAKPAIPSRDSKPRQSTTGDTDQGPPDNGGVATADDSNVDAAELASHGTEHSSDAEPAPEPPPRSNKLPLQRGAVVAGSDGEIEDSETGEPLHHDAASSGTQDHSAQSASDQEQSETEDAAPVPPPRPSRTSPTEDTPQPVYKPLDASVIEVCDAATNELRQDIDHYKSEEGLSEISVDDWDNTGSDTEVRLVNCDSMKEVGQQCIIVGDLLRGDNSEQPSGAESVASDDVAPIFKREDHVALLACRFRALMVLGEAFQVQHRGLHESVTSSSAHSGDGAIGWRIAREAVVVATKANEALEHQAAILGDDGDDADAGQKKPTSADDRSDASLLEDAIACKRLQTASYVTFCARYLANEEWEGQRAALSSCFDFMVDLLKAAAHMCLVRTC